jgi:hypothetical protein
LRALEAGALPNCAAQNGYRDVAIENGRWTDGLFFSKKVRHAAFGGVIIGCSRFDAKEIGTSASIFDSWDVG